MTTPISERRLANAIRTLAFEAVQKPILDIQVRRWAWQISLKCYGVSF